MILYSALAELWGVMGMEEQLSFSVFCYCYCSCYLSGRSESYRNPYICPTFSLSFSVLAVLLDDCSLAVQVNESVLSRLKEHLLLEKMVLSLFRSLITPSKYRKTRFYYCGQDNQLSIALDRYLCRIRNCCGSVLKMYNAAVLKSVVAVVGDKCERIGRRAGENGNSYVLP